MSHQDGWKSTPVGRLARFIGSVKFAVPALALATVAMIWGTWVDSTVGRAAAMGGVYGSWWFVALMALICASLVLSVAVRYPWQRKHVGFIIVHASLVALIALGFYTMNTKIEGRIVLEEGESSGYILMDERWVQLVEHTEQGFVPIEYTMLDKGPDGKTTTGEIDLAGHTIRILDVWANSEEATKILNDGENPLHAVEILSEPGQIVGDWVGQIEATQAAPMLNGFALRVVPTGETWTPPANDGPWIAWIDDAGNEHPLPEPGQPLGETGWTVTTVEHFERATIGAGGVITERELGPPNPAIRLTLTHANGAIEQQVVFERFRDSPFTEQIEGETASGLVVTYRGETFSDPTLAIMRDEDGRIHALYAEPGGTEVSYIHDGKWPWKFTVAETTVTILQDFANARAARELEERPEAETNSPAIVVTTGSEDEKVILRWNTPTPVQVGEETITLRYGPKTMQLPFITKLIDFRKLDYPGSQMAMAYESDVMITTDGQEPFPFRIYMNHPYKQDGWKVYQSGFVGDAITVLQVTKDPGLVPTYLASITLCIGILITFYSRSLSWGHPDIPISFKPSDHKQAQEV